jgi:outer membrane immunogenic protein
MRTLKLAAAAAGVLFAAPVFAQDMAPAAPADTAMAAPADTAPQAPDGTRAFGIEPYVGIMGGWEQFDNEPNHGIPQAVNSDGTLRNNYRLAGALVQGVVGFNVPLGPVFVGAEGNVAKGVSGNIDWEYGAAGRFGVRAGDSGMFYGKVGYQWVDFDNYPAFVSGDRNNKKVDGVTYGIGTEFGPKDIGLQGITGNAGFRIRAEVNTFGDFHSFRPMLGVITHF